MTADPLNKTPGRPTQGVGALVRRLLVDTDLDYAAILVEVRSTIPDTKTTVRSIASVASIARKAGTFVAPRKKVAAEGKARSKTVKG